MGDDGLTGSAAQVPEGDEHAGYLRTLLRRDGSPIWRAASAHVFHCRVCLDRLTALAEGLERAFNVPLAEASRLPELIEELTLAESAGAQPERAVKLLAKLTPAPDEYLAASEEDLEILVDRFRHDPSNRPTMAQVFGALQQFGQFDRLRGLVADVAPRLTDPEDAYTVRRALADALSTSGDAALEQEAMEMYREMLDHLPVDHEDLADVLHNFAANLWRHDLIEEAGRRWLQAYRLNPTGEVIKQAYASYLEGINQAASALVLLGEPVDQALSAE